MFLYKVISLNIYLGNEIIDIERGFVIYGDWGHSSKFYYDIFISCETNEFYIDSINIELWGRC